MNEVVKERKEEVLSNSSGSAKRGDLLTNLIVAAAEDEDEETLPNKVNSGKRSLSLSESELRGWASHELCRCLADC